MDIGHRTISMLIDAGYVTDYADQYGEPGYSTDKSFIVLGTYWCQDRSPDHVSEFGTCHSIEVHYPRLMAKLDEVAELEWYDEWIVANESSPSMAYRTTGDSYSWQSSILWTDGDFLTPEDDITLWIDEVVNNPQRCLPSHVWSDDQLGEQGFAEYQCGFESGWHPGQTDNPVEIDRLIRAEYAEKGSEVDVLFKLSHVGQFDIGFCVFVRVQDSEG